MNEPGAVTSEERRASGPVFISHATADRKQALRICAAIERRGAKCWIAARDVGPGANYQEAIVRAIRGARALLLVFSQAANDSDEIKKELSLASRHRIPVMALRIDGVEPSDAFAYELSTRQWIDASGGWDRSIEALADELAQISSAREDAVVRPISGSRRRSPGVRHLTLAAGAGALLLMILAGLWFATRPATPASAPLQVRLAGFQRLSNDLPSTMPAAMDDEITAAFGDDGVIRVSNAVRPPSAGPAYALAGTVGREGGKIRVITRLTNERTGTTLWSSSASYDAAQAARIPRRTAIDASEVIRCGLFGASTYPKVLPEPALVDYFSTCQNVDEPDKALDFARKVVAAVPDFSWGWSAVEIATFYSLLQRPPEARIPELRREGLAAADKALKLDPSNSEAYAYKAHLIDPADLVGRDKLFQQAIRARTLPCGCEHHFYGDFLVEVGRFNDAIAEYRRAIDILPLNSNSQMSLAQAYFATGRPDLAREHLAAALDLDGDPDAPYQLKATLGPITRDYAGALKAINDPDHGAPPPFRPALSAAFAALQSNDPQARTAAIAQLKALPPAARGGMYATLLAALGANREALDAVVTAVFEAKRIGARSWLFNPPFAEALNDPAFPPVAQRLGLINYWKSTGTKPDACQVAGPPAFCRMI